MNAWRDSAREPNRSAADGPYRAILSQMGVPAVDDLYAFTASIDTAEQRDPSARSDFHWQTFKCRLVVFSLPVLACPVRMPGAGLRDFTVICRRVDLDDDLRDDHQGGADAEPRPSPLRAKLAALKLCLSRLRPVSNAEYAACLEFTLAARVAPLWNPVAELLVQGKDFLTSSRLDDAVRLQVHVFGEKGTAWLSIYPSRVRMAPLALGDMDVSSGALDRFQDNPLGEVPATCIGNPWVHVLPSLKRGMVMSITKSIPAECPFQRYKDFRRHWKNMYGYRLPETSSDLPFVSVYFELIGKPMCYPWWCLTPRPPVRLPCQDPTAVAAAFLGAVAARMPTVCGYPAPLSLDGDLVVAEAALLAAGRADAPLQPNLRPAPTPATPRASTASQDDEVLTAPLSIATQRDGTRPYVEWNFSRAPLQQAAPRAARAQQDQDQDEDKENRPPQGSLQRPVFRSRAAVAAPRASPAGGMTWFRPRGASSPDDARSRSPAAGARPAAPSSASPGSSAARSPSASSRASERSASPVRCAAPPPTPSSAAGVAPSFRVPVHKPIFLSKFKPAPSKAPAPKAKQPAAPRLNASGNTPKNTGANASANALGNAPAGPSSSSKPSPKASKAPKAAKRPSTEPLPLADLRSAEACRRASVPVLLAWLRDKGVPCRAKDKKAELVDKAVAKVGELAAR